MIVIAPSQAAILRAAKAVPGARPAPPPQGASIGIGRLSPLAMELAEDSGYSRIYGPYMQRPAAQFTQGAFGPFSPILPAPIDEPPPGGQLPDPRRFEYAPGFNLPTIPGQDGYRLASFSTLEVLSRLHSITRTCIERRKSSIVGLDWDIVPTSEASKAYQGNHAAMHDFGKRRAGAVKFFSQPDPNYDSFGSFLSACLEQVFVYDALSILLKPKRGRGLRKGILGSDLDCIEQIDGATCRPLLSLSGGRPRPPAVGYQQFYAGVPRCDISAMWNFRDIEEAGLKGYEGPVFSTDQLIYKPSVPRVNSPYGFSAVEMALLVIMTGLRKQSFQLDYYNEGTIPSAYISPGDVNITPAQIRELQQALNGIASDPAWHHKVIVLPPEAKVIPMRAAQLADQFDEFLANEIAMVFDVDPISLGIVPNVASTVSPFAAREMAAASRTVHERTSTKPLLKFLCDIFNAILHRVLGQDDMKFTFAGMDEAADQAAVTDLLVKQVQNGIISVDEAREELERTPWGLPETSGPVVFTQAGVMPFEWVPGLALQQAEDGRGGPYSGLTPPSTKPGGPHGDTRPLGVHHPPSSRPWTGSRDLQHVQNDNGPSRAAIPPGAGRTGHTPAHAAAEGHASQTRTGGRSKAVRAELEALGRHLRKGRAVSTWEPRHLPGHVMASIAEDLTKGLGPDEVVREALAVALPSPEYEWTEKAAPAAVDHEQRIRDAFGQAAEHAAVMGAQRDSGKAAVTPSELASQVASGFRASLGPVLRSLHRDAWEQGKQEAAASLGTEPGSDEADREAWIASHGRDWLEQIARTREPELARLITASGGALTADSVAAVLGAGVRPDLIAGTEAARARNMAALGVLHRAGVQRKRWVLDRADACKTCKANAAQGAVPLAALFTDGSLAGPAHPGCGCGVVSADAPAASKLARSVDLNGQARWPAGSHPSGPAMGGGGRMLTAHDADGTEVFVPGGVPGMTAGGEPPRWDPHADDVTEDDGEQVVNAGLGNVQTRGGGTVGVPYADLSDRTHATGTDGGNDAAWPGERGVPPGRGTRWPLQGYMGGYWPQGGHGTAQAPGTSIGGGERGRAPSPHGKSASGYDLNPRSGMISLDLPDGLITPVPGGVTDHHVTICYLGPDVDDGAFALACLRASAAAALMSGPLCGVISGLGTFPASESGNGKVPVWAGVMLPGAEILREALADLSASQHTRWNPHVTLLYADPGDPLPEPVKPVPVTFTHLSVHRGGQVERFPLGVQVPALAGTPA